VAARLGAERVTLTDLPSELELLRRNAHDNGVEAAVRVAPCTWGDHDAVAALGTFDVVLCSDVLYGHHREVAARRAPQLNIRKPLLNLKPYFM
jgi:nicotinamide N-methyltransferase